MDLYSQKLKNFAVNKTKWVYIFFQKLKNITEEGVSF